MGKSTANATIVTLGIDLAKNVFQVHGVDGAGKVVLQSEVGGGRAVGSRKFRLTERRS